MIKFPKPMIAVVGDSGSGKTSSLRNLDWNETALLDAERKGLPFDYSGLPEANYYEITSPAAFDRAVAAVRKRPEIKTIVLDSLTSLLELEIAFARAQATGFQIYANYNARVRVLLNSLKSTAQSTIVIAIPMFIDVFNESGGNTTRRAIATVGNEWKGMIEKEFVAVLFTTVLRDEKTGDALYKFRTQTDGVNSAKCPPMAKLATLVDNDVAVVLKNLCPEPIK